MGATLRYIQIDDEKLLHPDYLKSLPTHRLLSYYRKRVAKLPSTKVYCDCCSMRRSEIEYGKMKNRIQSDGPSLIGGEDPEEVRDEMRKKEDLFIKYKNTVKSILDEKENVE